VLGPERTPAIPYVEQAARDWSERPEAVAIGGTIVARNCDCEQAGRPVYCEPITSGLNVTGAFGK